MKKVVAIIAAGAMGASTLPSMPAYSQATLIPVRAAAAPADNSAAMISSTIRAFPNGGEAMKVAISDFLVKHPELAAQLANYLLANQKDLSPAQLQAIEEGLADGLNRLGVVAQAGTGISPLLVVLGALAVGGIIYAVYKSQSGH